ncbi:thermonuclease family protein [Ectothiorhodospiraceae bacterium BW-2]|nr:thermonuclease family protein [Ectothiorhodospiraceae bacterium BW-2]
MANRSRLTLFWLVALTGLIAPWLNTCSLLLPATAPQSCRVKSVYDGDTTPLNCNGETIKTRFYCIDTPEMGQKPWGKQSRDHLRGIIGTEVTLKRHDTDRYGRGVAELFDATGQSVNLAMVRAGRAPAWLMVALLKLFSMTKNGL